MCLQVASLHQEVFRANAAKLAEFEADKPRLKGFLNALNQQRVALKNEIAQLQARAANASSAPVLQPKGIVYTLYFLYYKVAKSLELYLNTAHARAGITESFPCSHILTWGC